jgi:hypothetical protein
LWLCRGHCYRCAHVGDGQKVSAPGRRHSTAFSLPGCLGCHCCRSPNLLVQS